MGQAEILLVLEQQKKPLSRGEIAVLIKSDPIHISHSIQRLVKGKSIKIIEIDRYQAMQRFNCKRRMRLYYI